MRIDKSLKNMYSALLYQIVMIVMGLVTRRLFVDNLGTEYLGINGLLCNVLSMLSLVEGGIGTSIVYNLYKPLAMKEEEKVLALIQLYKKIYIILAIVVCILSIALYPLVVMLTKGTVIINLTIIYFIFVIKNVISYLNAHKYSLISADQNEYILQNVNTVLDFVTSVFKIVVLLVAKNYVLFLVIEALFFAVKNIYNGHIVNKKYPYILKKEKYKIDRQVKENLVTNVKAVSLHQIGSYCVFSTDNILISMFISLSTVGLYSNYVMIINQMTNLLNNILFSIGASVGNMIATESEEKNYDIFKKVYFVNFWMYSIATIFLYNLLNPFINWWLGDGLLLDSLTFIVIIINFYITGLRQCTNIFKGKGGIFAQDKYMPLMEAVINLGASIALVRFIGLAGIFFGTAISTLVIPFWNQPRLIYKNIFKRSLKDYFKQYILYLIIAFLCGAVTTAVCNFVVREGDLISLIIKGSICIVFSNIVYILIFCKTEEFLYFSKAANNILAKKCLLHKNNNL